MRRAIFAATVLAIFAFTATPAAACTIALAPLNISPVAGGPGTEITASGYCDGDATVSLGFPTRSDALRPGVDSVSIRGNSGSFSVTLTNNYAPPVPPGTPYRYDMEVTMRCGDVFTRVPFFATDHVTHSQTHLFTVPSDGACGYGLAPTEAEARIPCPANVRGFDDLGNASAFVNSYVRTDGDGGSVAVLRVPTSGGADQLVVGTGPGTEAAFSMVGSFGGAIAYPSFRGGVNVAVGDVDGDGNEDIVTGAGPSGGPHVKVWKIPPPDPDFPSSTCGPQFEQSAGWYAYDPAFGGGVSVAAADLDGDGKAEIITGALAGGGPHVRVFDETGRLKHEFMAYDPNFRGGVNVAAADVLTQGRAQIVTGAGPGGGPHVLVFDKSGVALRGFYAYAPEWTGGVYVAAGRPVHSSPQAKIVTGAGPGGGPHVRVFDAAGIGGGGFFAYDNIPAGVRVAVAP